MVENAIPGLTDRVNRLQLEQLPHPSRNFTALLALQNGYRPARDGLIQFNGLASGGLTLTVDGVDGSGSAEVSSPSMFQNFNPIKVMSEDAIQEVVVSKGVMSTEYSHTYSGNINVITKSGTNQLHGSLFETVQNNEFDDTLWATIRQHKLLFFFAYEVYRQAKTTLTNGQGTTESFRQHIL